MEGVVDAGSPKAGAEALPAPALPPADRDEAGANENVRLVSLEAIAPTPPSSFPSTALVRMRSQPEGGERERLQDVAVVSRCDERSCLDGLRDLRTGRDLIALAATRDEREILDVPGSVQRVVKLAYVSDDVISIYTGATELSGGAHANNELACATYDRRTGRPVDLTKVVPPPEAPTLLRRASEKLKAFLRESGHQGYQIHKTSFLYDAASARVTLCALAPMPMDGTIIAVPLQR